MKDWYFKRQLKSSNVCVGLYKTRISDFVFRRRRCRFPNSLLNSKKPRHTDVALILFLLRTLTDAIDDLDLRVKDFLSSGGTATQEWKDENYKSLKQVLKL